MAKFQHSPSRVLVDDVFIKKPAGSDRIDITPITSEINIETSLFDPTTSIIVTILDGNNFLVEFGVESGDEIEMSIVWSEKPISIKATVIRVRDVANADNSRVYNIQCVSKFFFESLKTKISRSVFGKLSEIAADIYNEYTDETVIHWEESRNKQKLILPYKRPSQIMKMLANRSQSAIDDTTMYFFQDSKMNYNFASLEYLVKINEGQNVAQYVYNVNDLDIDTLSKARRIESLSMSSISDLPFHTNKSAYSSTYMLNDINTKVLDIVTHNYWDDYDNGVHLNKKPLHTQVEMDEKAEIEAYGFCSSQFPEVPKNIFTDRTDLKRSLLNASHAIDITVNSNEVVDVGQVVEILIPAAAPRVKGDEGIDKYWSGHYLVTAKREMIKDDVGKIALTLIKDSRT